MRRTLGSALLGLLLLLPLACGRGGEEAILSDDEASEAVRPLDYLVRVGDHALQQDVFENILPQEFRGLLTYEEKFNYLERWADTELLYQAAQARERGTAD